MLPERRMFEDEECPVSVDVLGAMYRASPHGLKELIESVPQSVRGMLAPGASLFDRDRHRGDLRRGGSHTLWRQRRRHSLREIP
jgi:hypothetical protein